MSSGNGNIVSFDMNHLPPGRIDRSRMGKHNPDDTEPRPVVTAEDWEATRRLAADQKPRTPRASS